MLRFQYFSILHDLKMNEIKIAVNIYLSYLMFAEMSKTAEKQTNERINLNPSFSSISEKNIQTFTKPEKIGIKRFGEIAKIYCRSNKLKIFRICYQIL